MVDFQIGDVVMLKSGGPKMTVTYLGNDQNDQPSVSCTWFIENNTKQENGAFPVQAVEAVVVSSAPLQTHSNTG